MLEGLLPVVRGATGTLEFVWPRTEEDGKDPDDPMSAPAELELRVGFPVPAGPMGFPEALVGAPAEVPKE